MRSTLAARPSAIMKALRIASFELELFFCLLSSGEREETSQELEYLVFLLTVEVNYSIDARLNFNLRGCLCKNLPLNFASKIILPETLVTERIRQG